MRNITTMSNDTATKTRGDGKRTHAKKTTTKADGKRHLAVGHSGDRADYRDTRRKNMS